MILDNLNPQQKEAVECVDGALLLLAGAGSGKTKTLTSRLAYLICQIGIPANSILCLTFTNKAAQEMRERAMKLIHKTSFGYPLLCTFHKFGLMFLKQHISLLHRPNRFVLLDSDDVKKIIKSLQPSQTTLSVSTLMHYISYFKNQAIGVEEVLKNAKGKEAKEVAQVYCDYEQYLLSHHLVDFDDLLYLPFLILQNNPSLAKEMSEKYAYIMVDEYQDTNVLQYKLLRLLTTAHQNLCVVGDEDQSIYGWRGADIRNILEFEKDFVGAKVIKLEKNYRSTPQILSFANNLISCNTQRLGKTLQPTQQSGELVEIHSFADEKEEIAFVAKEVLDLQKKGERDIAILYRLNALSRNIEEGLNRAKIAYKLIGSVRFYERAEIKDALSYFRLMVNMGDDFSLLRVLNRPKRGVGKTSQEKLQALRNGRTIYSLYQEESHLIPSKILLVLKDFFALICECREKFAQNIDSFIAFFKEKIPLLEEFPQAEWEDRGANLDELFGLLREFVEKNPEGAMEDFLNDLSLSSDLDKESDGEVCCMSMHSSKGLEFDYVFVVGCEDGFFPLNKENESLEEERRLGYVAFTRAKRKLVLSYVASRFYKGKRQILKPSLFLKEAQKEQVALSLRVGANVKHKVFGVGRVKEIKEKKQDEAKVLVNFGGNERLILSSFLEVIE